jgi:hypothetical protein
MALFDELLIVLRGSNGRRYQTKNLRLKNLSTKIELPLSACSVKMRNSRQDGTDRVRQECPGKTANWLSDSCKLRSSILQ